jgi:hypothetical protein
MSNRRILEIIRAWGLDPEQILTREALTQPHRTVIDRNDLMRAGMLSHLQIQSLLEGIKLIHKLKNP